MAKGPTNRMIGRGLFVLLVLIVLGFSYLGVQLFKIQIIDYDQYQEKAIKQQTRDTVISPKRGTIFDRNGKILAKSASVETIFMSPLAIKDENEAKFICENLSALLGVDYDTLMNKTKKKNYYEIVKTKVEKEEADKVRVFVNANKLGHVIDFAEDSKRYYPFGNFASHILGFTGTDGYGLMGLEARYDTYLKGVAGRKITVKNGIGTDMPFKFEDYIDAQNGLNVVLTIDEVVQHFLEKHLETAIIENNVKKRATGIVMDVKTGEILAMATKPDFDLNKPFEITDTDIKAEIDKLTGEERTKYISDVLNQIWRNKPISDTYDPGSTFKIITAAMALEEGVVDEDDTFYCPGYKVVAGRRISCWKRQGHGSETFVKGFENSCNPVFMEIGARVGPEKFYKYFEAFGLTQKTGIDIGGEALSIYHSEKALRGPVELATSSFGQTFKLTPIQLITAVSAVANGGYLMEPHLVKQLVDDEGNVKKEFKPKMVRQVISEKTSKELCRMLGLVVSEGTGKNAYVMGYRVGGKTGTSEKTGEKDENGRVPLIASFLGIAPVDDPAIAVLVILDEPYNPNRSLISGGIMAAPVVGNIMADVLPYLGVEPKFTENELKYADIEVPNVTSLSLGEAQKKLRAIGLNGSVEGKGDKVLDQIPKPGMKIPKSGKIILYTEQNIEKRTVKVPNLKGKTAAEVNRALGGLALNAKFLGAPVESGAIAISQHPAEGAEVECGTVVSVEFRHTDAGESGE